MEEGNLFREEHQLIKVEEMIEIEDRHVGTTNNGCRQRFISGCREVEDVHVSKHHPQIALAPSHQRNQTDIMCSLLSCTEDRPDDSYSCQKYVILCLLVKKQTRIEGHAAEQLPSLL